MALVAHLAVFMYIIICNSTWISWYFLWIEKSTQKAITYIHNYYVEESLITCIANTYCVRHNQQYIHTVLAGSITQYTFVKEHG